ncbi:hypothetical protein HanRHA438_Chr17g0839901 [Helianthus annuus]|nr:hypothetical protein HanRHA438_Chr17g0839901 [Helianthus annuus]
MVTEGSRRRDEDGGGGVGGLASPGGGPLVWSVANGTTRTGRTGRRGTEGGRCGRTVVTWRRRREAGDHTEQPNRATITMTKKSPNFKLGSDFINQEFSRISSIFRTFLFS